MTFEPSTISELLDGPDTNENPYVRIHRDVEQHSEEWLQLRSGILTASEMKLIITPKNLTYASNEKERNHLYDLAAQRITKFVDEGYQSDKMMRGILDEDEALKIYNERFNKIERVGFITNTRHGFKLGYSPDALSLDGEGQAEVKSRDHKFQLQTFLADEMPEEYLIQVQTGLLASERKWCDFLSFSGGMPMYPKKIFPDEKIQKALIEVGQKAEEKITKMIALYYEIIASNPERFIPTTRRVEQEIY